MANPRIPVVVRVVVAIAESLVGDWVAVATAAAETLVADWAAVATVESLFRDWVAVATARLKTARTRSQGDRGGDGMGQAEAVTTRLAGLDDIPAMIRISADIWDGDDYIPRVARQWICDPKGRFVVAECDGVVRGFGRLAMRTLTDGWLEGLRVDSSFRRHGVARAIARRLLEEAKDAGAKSLRFATARDNIESIALNESLGFVRIGGFRHFYCDPEPLPAVIQAAKSRADGWPRSAVSGLPGLRWKCFIHLARTIPSRWPFRVRQR